WQAAATIRGDLGFAQLVSATSWFDRDQAYEWDNMAYNQWQTSYYALYNGKDRYDFQYEFGSIFNDQIQERFTQEVRLISQGESRLDWMVGAFYEDVRDAWDYGAQIPNFMKTRAWETVNEYACYYAAAGYDVACPLPPTNRVYNQLYDNTVKQTAVFGEATWHITPQWRVTAGSRWFRFERDREQIYSTPEGKPPVGSFGVGEGRYESQGSDKAEVFKFGMQYDLDEDRMLYLLYSEGFRLGGQNSPRAAATGRVPAEYDPDTMQNYEAGLKSEWLDNSLQLNLTVFLMKWDDIQLNRSARPWWLRGTFNGDGGESKGVEINWNWRVTENLQFDGSAFVAKAEYTGTTLGPTGSPLTRDGQKMPTGPEEKFRFGLEYTLPQFAGLPGEFRVRYDSTYTGEIWDNLDDSYYGDTDGLIPDAWYSNLQLSYDSGESWEVGLLARNVWDNQGITNIVRGSANDYADWFDDPRFRNERTLYRPRTITLNLRVDF
ncbi:MAG: TonB-dependent receptor, partial [Gammaproteobacteria bacterium]